MTDEIQTTRDYSSQKLTLHYYADPSVPNSTGQMYEDDGMSRTSIEDGAYELLRFEANHSGDFARFEFRREGQGYEGMPSDRDVELVIHNWTGKANSISVNGHEIPVTEQLPADGAGAIVDGTTLTVRFNWHRDHVNVQVNEPEGKPVVYQVWTRLFGNKMTTNKPWGTIEENGVGKFADFTDEALRGIRELGVSHIWYTGVPHHALVRDYTDYGISNPAVATISVDGLVTAVSSGVVLVSAVNEGALGALFV